MTDSPAVQAVLDPREQPILEKLLGIRDRLLLLKEDKSTYIKSQDVLRLYEEVVEQVEPLDKIRGGKLDEESRLDRTLDDCFQLISLFFMTIGRNNEAPAVYATMSSMKRLLDHLKEVTLYCAKDLQSIAHRLEITREVIKRGRERYSPVLLKILEDRLALCDGTKHELQDRLALMAPELEPIQEKLISILRSISAANTKKKFSSKEVQSLQEQLQEIDSRREDGNFIGSNGQILAGQDLVNQLLHRCLVWADLVLTRAGNIDEGFKPAYDQILEIRNQLEKLSLTHPWSLRETDLFTYQRNLDRIDEKRVDGNFVNSEGRSADLFEQRTLLYLLRRSYALIYTLIISSEPVSEALLPIYNQLQTLRRCLLEVQRSGGVSSPRELYPYSMKLHSIESARKDGKFMVGQDIPEGQGSVNALMAECFELNYELRINAESDND
ncbi:MAG: tRNA-specific adenosine deaminase subunit tad3 [Chaenotheca gracillima]|nr:MAG: tRNA-specific adenosine deaminase subunit tad3 [Chaenotheca gracillima]